MAKTTEGAANKSAANKSTANKNKGAANKDKGPANKDKGPANKNKDAANKNKDAANVDEEVIAHVAKMLNEHHDELQDALKERHDQIIARLKYDPVSISNRSTANNNLVCREVQTKSKSPFQTIQTIGSRLTRGVAAKDVKAKTKAMLVKTLPKGKYNC